MDEQRPFKRYRANCHCKAYVFEVDIPETIDTGLVCNCKYCYKRGAIYQCPKNSDDIEFVKGDPATLTSYSFGDVKHQFCPTCSNYLLRVDNKKTYVNLRIIQNFNTWDLPTEPINSASPPEWTPPKFTGTEPQVEIEGAKMYTGGCHCGAVTLALKSKPIDSTYDAPLVECDCSICCRQGYLWIYPSKSQVTTQGWENMGYYSFGRGVWRKTFCRTCGIPIQNHIEDYTPERIEAEIPEEHQQWAREHLEWSPINLRVLEGVNLGELKFRRVNGMTRRGPFYENP
ncbi:Mss4-like protein [Hypomontagnella monticulosa]|nr:Mss4-like protein [Hypomontagnella monticulosa]